MAEIDQLTKVRDGLTVYDAGLPRFPRNFTRDGILSALLFHDAEMMHDQVRFCALHQGQRNDPHTGEEVGKIFHEFPGFPLRGKNTQFNGCDTTGLWLYGLASYVEWTDDESLATELRSEIEAALGYVRRHVDERGLLNEDPAFCGADRFALKVTYWKDSVLVDRPNGEPIWPAIFPLAHVQTLAGVRGIGRILNDQPTLDLADKMLAALPLLWDNDLGNFYPAIDQAGAVKTVTSDGLHILAYLETGDLWAEAPSQITLSSQVLETELGYVVMNSADAARVDYDYHAKTVWPFEQGMIHIGATRFNLRHVAAVCERVIPHIQKAAPETLATVAELTSKSCDPQLWTLAARHYFAAQTGTAYENSVAAHYSFGGLLDRIERALAEVGKSAETITIQELAPIDEFHVGGRTATQHLLDQLNLSEDTHLLDVGCGVGGLARVVASQYASRVTGLDLTPEFVEVGNTLCGWVGLDHRINLQQGSALMLPFEADTFDGATLLHVGMNIEDKAKLFAEIYRVLRPGAFLALYDIMQTSDEALAYPVPWAMDESTSKVATPEQYADAIRQAGFAEPTIDNRRDFALVSFQQARAQSGQSPLSLKIVMQANAGDKVRNLAANIARGRLAPVEMIAYKVADR